MGASPHVIVVGNEKGGSGKTTIAMHVAVALLKAGQRVATIDLDGRQRTLTNYIENRRGWAARCRLPLKLSQHFVVGQADCCRIDENERVEFAAFDEVVRAVQNDQDFVIIDTPPHDSYLARLAHSMTDTLVTPLNDSLLDLDVLVKLDPVDFSIKEVSHYGELAREARRLRRLIDGVTTDWVVVPNRLSAVNSRNKRQIDAALSELSVMLGFRLVKGLAERLIYRENFVRGLTALDEGSKTRFVAGGSGSSSFKKVREEVRALVDGLRLPITERGRTRAAVREEWFKLRDQPLELDDMLKPPSDKEAA